MQSAGKLRADTTGKIAALPGILSHIRRTASWLLLLVYLYLLFRLKYYYLAALLPAIMAFLLTDTLVRHFLPGKSLSSKVVLLVIVFAGILAAASLLHPNLHIANFLEALVTNHDITLQASAPQNSILFENLLPEAGSIAKHLPEAVFSGMFRPLVWEGNTIFHWCIGLENLLLLLLSLYVLFFRRGVITQIQPSYVLLIVSTLMYVGLLAALLALSSPNFGALSRYKVAFIPFYAFLLFRAVCPGKQPAK
jgi:hypothetical protein